MELRSPSLRTAPCGYSEATEYSAHLVCFIFLSFFCPVGAAASVLPRLEVCTYECNKWVIGLLIPDQHPVERLAPTRLREGGLVFHSQDEHLAKGSLTNDFQLTDAASHTHSRSIVTTTSTTRRQSLPVGPGKYP